jgi:hypothetical protein
MFFLIQKIQHGGKPRRRVRAGLAQLADLCHPIFRVLLRLFRLAGAGSEARSRASPAQAVIIEKSWRAVPRGARPPAAETSRKRPTLFHVVPRLGRPFRRMMLDGYALLFTGSGQKGTFLGPSGN